jgi:hypothetical protein
MTGRASSVQGLRWVQALLLSLMWATMDIAAALAERSDFGHSSLAANSAGKVSYRLGSPVAEIPRYEFAMMSHEQRIASVVEKYGINLRGRQVVFDPKLGTGQLGMTAQANPMVMRVGSGVMNSETELAATIAHELRHSRAYMGSGLNTEAAAEASEGALRSFIQGGR